MTQHDPWDEQTPPATPETLALLRDLREDVKYLRGRANQQDETLGAIAASFSRDFDELRKRVDAGFERLGELVDKAYRRADDSSHDLSQFKTETRKKLMWKNISSQTAIIVAVLLAGYFGLLIAGREVPTWLMSIVGVIGVAIAGAAPALIAQKPPTGGAS